MKTGAYFGFIGCTLWLLNIATHSKPQWMAFTLAAIAIVALVAGTIITGAQKGRMRLGIGLSPLSVVFGLGFLIILVVPEKKVNRVV
jgi:hypothetical protein